MTTSKQYEDSLKERLEGMLREAYEDGFVFTVSLVPNTPLAMGYYQLKVDVREKRELATPIVRPTPEDFATIRNVQASFYQHIDDITSPFIVHTYTGSAPLPIPPARQAFIDIVAMLNKSRGVNIALSDKHIEEGEGYMETLMVDHDFQPSKTNLWVLLNKASLFPYSTACKKLHELLDTLYDNS